MVGRWDWTRWSNTFGFCLIVQYLVHTEYFIRTFISFYRNLPKIVFIPEISYRSVFSSTDHFGHLQNLKNYLKSETAEKKKK